jgi:hypothetical protein
MTFGVHMTRCASSDALRCFLCSHLFEMRSMASAHTAVHAAAPCGVHADPRSAVLLTV